MNNIFKNKKMKKGLLIAILFLILSSCTRKLIETRIESDYEVFKTRYEACKQMYSNLDSAKYYDEQCKKEAMKASAKLQPYLIYKRNGKIIREEKIIEQ